MYPGKLEEIEEYEMGSHSGGGFDVGSVVREQVPDIADLENKEGDPIDADKDVTGGEGGVVMITEAEDCVIPVAVFVAAGGSMRGVHDREDQVEEETQDGAYFVPGDVTLGTFTIPCEWVWESHCCCLM